MFRKGDKVTVEGVVTWDEEGGSVFVKIDGRDVFMPRGLVTLVSPMLSIGETVEDKLGFGWEVLAMHEDLVWCGAGGETKVYKASDLSRVTPYPVSEVKSVVSLVINDH